MGRKLSNSSTMKSKKFPTIGKFSNHWKDGFHLQNGRKKQNEEE